MTGHGRNGEIWSTSLSSADAPHSARQRRQFTMAYPQKLQSVIDTFAMFDPADRTSMLLSYADQFQEVPNDVAKRPFDRSHQVPQCESDAYAWAIKRPDGSLKLYFAVENPLV